MTDLDFPQHDDAQKNSHFAETDDVDVPESDTYDVVSVPLNNVYDDVSVPLEQQHGT